MNHDLSKILPVNEELVPLGQVIYDFVWVRKWSSTISQNVSVKLSRIVGDPTDQSTQGKLKSPVIIKSAIPLPETLLRNLLNSSNNLSPMSGGL